MPSRSNSTGLEAPKPTSHVKVERRMALPPTVAPARIRFGSVTPVAYGRLPGSPKRSVP